MRVAVFWTGVSAPMAACWRALAAVPGYNVRVFVEEHKGGAQSLRHERVLNGLDYQLTFSGNAVDYLALERNIRSFSPEIMLVLGWHSKMCRFAAESQSSSRTPKVFAFDMPFSWSFRKMLARPLLWRYLRRFSSAFVPGDLSFRYARWLGFPEKAIHRGLIAVDTSEYADACQLRNVASDVRRRFVFVGRYSRCKGIAVLIEGYRRYRRLVNEPWELVCHGSGDQGYLLKGVEGVRDAGFTQPEMIPRVLANAGALVLPSIYDPWPMVILESIAAGLPVCCTTACGNHKELLTSGLNGFISSPGSTRGLARSLEMAQETSESGVSFATAGVRTATLYSTARWASRVDAICKSLRR